MTGREFFKLHNACRKEGLAEKVPGSDVLRCVTHGGECKLVKCLNLHNGGIKQKG